MMSALVLLLLLAVALSSYEALQTTFEFYKAQKRIEIVSSVWQVDVWQMSTRDLYKCLNTC